ncbi:RluA family pseudouridine synthase [Virgibacillus alimentarius]|uniref:RNA pseudouridylate synthase n=1 Tax=Virgibacillus alimentarius TaxID=698769 RepID=A0ABS4SAC1_9BACI|nr:RluA family pseudouridine synthase [Virgibacillus alimentarius]MBP2258461.1 23S rRNA pseudouridine1911/1915/1917 synthase [Virgibacillus alimentarius]
MNIPILYEDNHLLVVEKPVNMPVQKDKTEDDDLHNFLKRDLKIRYQKPGNVYLGLVHRLDRPVGGAIVFAKTSKAASRLSDMLRRRVIHRKYLAVVRGVPLKREATLEHYLVKNRRKNKVFTTSPGDKQAKKAVLDYEVLDVTGDMSLLSVELHTGRPHQIRVQLAETGCPLYGDQKYGGHTNKIGEQIALWAHYLQFEHPVKKEPVSFHSKPPKKHPWTQWSTGAWHHPNFVE